MMGGLIFMLNHKMCVGVDMDKTSKEDRLMVRVGTNSYDLLLSKKGSRGMDFTGKVMRGFLFIDANSIDSEDDLDFWIEQALSFNREQTT